MTKTRLATLAAFLISYSFNAIAGNENTPATPFGIEMGSPGSCEALPKKLKSIDPRVRHSPAGVDGLEVPGTFSYAPMDKVFPGARQNMIVICVDGKIKFMAMSVARGAGDILLLEVVSGLNAKYRRFNASKGLDAILADDGQLSYSAQDTSIQVNVPKKRDSFSITYDYTGPLTNDAIGQLRRKTEESSRRRNAL